MQRDEPMVHLPLCVAHGQAEVARGHVEQQPALHELRERRAVPRRVRGRGERGEQRHVLGPQVRERRVRAAEVLVVRVAQRAWLGLGLGSGLGLGLGLVRNSASSGARLLRVRGRVGAGVGTQRCE